MNLKENRLCEVAILNRDIITRAQLVAQIAHYDQDRKWTGQPYISHPYRVAQKIANHPGTARSMIAAAYLHDTIEDCDWFTTHTLFTLFNERVCSFVMSLTNTMGPEGALRAERKQLERARLSSCDAETQLIKAFDRIDNLSDMDGPGVPPKFKKLFVQESILLAHALDKLPPGIERILLDWCERIGNEN